MGYCLILGIGSLYPSSEIPKVDILSFDKIIHVTAYFVLSSMMLLFWFKRMRNRQSIAYTFCFSLSYGLLLEILQITSFSNREFDIFDIIANIIGVILGIAFFLIFKRKN